MSMLLYENGKVLGLAAVPAQDSVLVKKIRRNDSLDISAHGYLFMEECGSFCGLIHQVAI